MRSEGARIEGRSVRSLNPLSPASPSPRVRLLNAFPRPYDNAVAAAMTCYSARIVTAEDLGRDEVSREKRDRVAERTYGAGHNTTQQHNYFQFAVDGVSRYLIWSFLHEHPFYNTEQVSQRYVRVRPESVHVPPLTAEGESAFLEASRAATAAYEKLSVLLVPAAETAYGTVFPARREGAGIREKFRREIGKKTQEVARYVLPIATFAHLHHTVSGLTLHRYRRLANAMECGPEARVLVGAMCEEVERHDPDFFRLDRAPLAESDAPEHRVERGLPEGSVEEWVEAFDRDLGGRFARLVDCGRDPEGAVARAVRNVAGVTSERMTDAEALAWALDPALNPHITDTLNLAHHGRLSKALSHAHFTFMKKLSLSADAQDQRHRTVLGSRPNLARLFRPSVPDYIVPALVAECAEAEDLYRSFMESHWARMRLLLDRGEPLASILYLLPNAFPVRFEESGDLLSLRHKWAMRLCFNAQEEIWRASCDEVSEVRRRFPELGKWMQPPCGMRKFAGVTPCCPEGAGFCGVPVWKEDLSRYRRII